MTNNTPTGVGHKDKKMSSTPANPPGPPAGQAPAFTTAQLVQAAKENFVVISGMALIFGVILATTFLTGYLTVFDWHLFWFVQYTDIITFGLLALGIISGSFLTFQALTTVVISTFQLTKSSQVRWMWGFGLFLLAFIILQVWGAVHQGQGYFHILWSILAVAVGVTVIVLISRHAISGTVPTFVQFVSLIVLVLIGAGGLGKWLGYSVLETETPQEIRIKNATMNGMKVIIVLSRHTVLLKDHDLYVVPTGDISEFHRIEPTWQF